MSVIFDWSGVVKDAMSAHFWVVNRIFKKYGVKEIPFKELRAGWVEPFMMFYNKYLPEMTIEEERSDYKEFMQMSDYPEAKIYLGIGDLLRKLKNNNCFLAVVSADFKNILETEINNFGLVNIFDEIVTDTHDKTTAVQELIDKYNLDKNRTFFVGDSVGEIEVSRKLEIKSVAVTWGLSSEVSLKNEKPDFLAHDVKELAGILRLD